MSGETGVLQFVSVSSFVQSSFWNKLSEIKINIDKLNESEREIWGFFSNRSSTFNIHVVEVDSTSFNSTFDAQNLAVPFHGKLFNKNTIEQFRECNKSDLINAEGKHFLDNLRSSKVLQNPSLINNFFILSFSDLKKFHFYYWFAFPVPHNLEVAVKEVTSISEKFSGPELQTLKDNYLKLNSHQKSYFLVYDCQVYTLQSKLSSVKNDDYQDYYFAFSDYANENRPKSQLKNYILFLLHHCPFLGGKAVTFLSFSFDKTQSLSPSTVFKLVPPSGDVDSLVYSGGANAWAGWEKNEKNKFAPRFSNMKATMDPQILFEESVDLNLKLMKWRLVPDIDLDKIKHAKCLLLGAGTLGCSVARNLLGWGVRNITFVDNSTVSYSNPVRQHLFTYEDAVNAKPKAVAAAENLRKIFPAVNSKAYQFTIPMPGHNVAENTVDSVKTSVDQLCELITQHDVIFLLTDSRESRWLPTLLGVSFNKIVLNVALGFDSYLIMRYGRGNDEAICDSTKLSGDFKIVPGPELGCYFCNDVTAPGNSMKDRTLDQQCTVTRPGVSSIAGALAVELAVSILQHPDGINAAAFYKTGPQSDIAYCEESASILGIVPHSIRGFLSSFSHVLPATPKYNQCIACSNTVLQEYKSKGFEFLMEAFNDSKYLENLTGLTALFSECNYEDVVEISDEEWGN